MTDEIETAVIEIDPFEPPAEGVLAWAAEFDWTAFDDEGNPIERPERRIVIPGDLRDVARRFIGETGYANHYTPDQVLAIWGAWASYGREKCFAPLLLLDLYRKEFGHRWEFGGDPSGRGQGLKSLASLFDRYLLATAFRQADLPEGWDHLNPDLGFGAWANGSAKYHGYERWCSGGPALKDGTLIPHLCEWPEPFVSTIPAPVLPEPRTPWFRGIPVNGYRYEPEVYADTAEPDSTTYVVHKVTHADLDEPLYIDGKRDTYLGYREFVAWVGGLDDDLEAFVEGVDRALTEHFGPNHQDVLSQGKIVSEFDWIKK